MANLQLIKEEYERIIAKVEAMAGVDQNETSKELTKADLDQILAFLNEWEKNVGILEVSHFCPNHLLEVYLYDYYISKEDCHCLDYKIHELYRIVAKDYAKRGKEQLALEAFYKAVSYNEIDLDTLFELANFHYQHGKLDEFKHVLEQLYAYCYSRNDIARYYRLLGCYYLESYQPELAEALYSYSNLFQESKLAENELQFLEKALKRKRKNDSLPRLQEILIQNEIPIQPKQETLAMVYQLGKQQMKQGNMDYAKFLFICLYQLTGDEEVKEFMEQIG